MTTVGKKPSPSRTTTTIAAKPTKPTATAIATTSTSTKPSVDERSGAKAAERIAGPVATRTDTVRFQPADSFKYECTIHTFQMKGDDGKTYKVVLDLIRSDENPAWGVSQDRRALRAVVMDDAGNVIAKKFVDKPKDAFTGDVGDMKILGDDGNIAFTSARDANGQMKDGEIDFDLDVTMFKSTLAQSGADLLKAGFEKLIDALPPDQAAKAQEALALQLLVTDYPKTQHSGSMTVKLPGSDKPLTLTADKTPSTVSHHYGNSLTDYVFIASVPKPGKPSFIAVVTRAGIDLDKDQAGPEVKIPFGYLIRTDEKGNSSFSLLDVDADKTGTGKFDIGADFLGRSIDIDVKHKAGDVVLNDGGLPTQTFFGKATVHNSQLLNKLGLQKSDVFDDVVIDVTGSFLRESGIE